MSDYFWILILLLFLKKFFMVLYDFKRIFKNRSCSAQVECTVKTADFIEILTHLNVFFSEHHTKNIGEALVGFKIVNIDALSSMETVLIAQLPPDFERIMHQERILKTYLFDFFT